MVLRSSVTPLEAALVAANVSLIVVVPCSRRWLGRRLPRGTQATPDFRSWRNFDEIVVKIYLKLLFIVKDIIYV